MADPEDFAGRKRINVAEVEQDCPAAEPEIQQEPRVGKDVVDQARLDEPCHGKLPPRDARTACAGTGRSVSESSSLRRSIFKAQIFL
jgi:hypothetical protein